MAIDVSVPLRRAVILLLAADGDVAAEVPEDRIYGQTVEAKPVFPFIRTGAPAPLPLRASCVDGSVTSLAVHAFAKDRMASGAVVETAEDWAGRIGALIAAALDGKKIALPNGEVRLRWTGSQPMLQDPDEPGCFHAVVNIAARALTA